MKLKTRWLWLGYTVVVLVLGGYFLSVRWASDRRFRAALPLEEQQILDKSQQFILYSLHPRPMELDAQELKTKPTFHGYMILGQTQVADAKTKDDLLGALYGGIGKIREEEAGMCFFPRHGIRAVRGSKTVDLVICFECKQIEIYDERGKSTTTISDSPQPVFDRAF